MRRKDREVTEMEEIQQIFDECKVCRIGIMDENGPYIVPVNYGYVREEGKVILYIHGAREGKKIDLIRKNANVKRKAKGPECYHEAPDRQNI